MTSTPARWLGMMSITVLVVACSGPSASMVSSIPPTVSPSAPPTEDPSLEPSPVASAAITVRPGEPWIAFQTETTSYGVHLVRPDGTDLHRWTAAIPGTQEHPDWSPDGEWIMVNAVQGGIEDVWVARVDGSDERLLVDCESPCIWADEASWSPDGTWAIFQRLASKDGGGVTSTLERVDIETGTTTVLLTMPPKHIVLAPRFGADGERVTVEVVRLPEDSFTVDPDGGAIGVVDISAEAPEVTLPHRLRFVGKQPGLEPDRGRDRLQPAHGARLRHVRLALDRGRRVRSGPADRRRGIRRARLPPDRTRRTDRACYSCCTTRSPIRDGVASIAVDRTDLRPAIGDAWVGGMHPRLRAD